MNNDIQSESIRLKTNYENALHELEQAHNIVEQFRGREIQEGEDIPLLDGNELLKAYNNLENAQNKYKIAESEYFKFIAEAK